MSLYVLHTALNGAYEPLPWDLQLTEGGIVLLAARNLQEAMAYGRAYELMAVIVDLHHHDAPCPGDLGVFNGANPEARRPAMIGLSRGELTAAERKACADNGFDALYARTDPPRFLKWQLETLAALRELARFEQSRADIGELAGRSREIMHDLSQPLSAIQGRLQLLALRCPKDDPNGEGIRELVRLCMQVSQWLMELQQLHRRYS